MRLILILLALFHGVNGLLMLAAPAAWYAAVPGVAETGPLNDHFVRDIGLGFIAAAAGLALARAAHAMLWPAAIFLGGHATLHLFELAHAASAGDATRDFLLILLPGLLPIWLAVLSTRSKEATP